MRNKKTFVGLFVILALLCLGIGYASITKTLRINGEIGTGKAEDLAGNFDVYFSSFFCDTVNIDQDIDVNVSLGSEKSLVANFSATNFTKVGSSVVIKFTVKNDSKNLYAKGPGVNVANVAEDGTTELDYLTPDGFYPIDSAYPNRWCYKTVDGYFEIIVHCQHASSSSIAPNGGTQDVTVTVTLANSPLEAVNYSFAFILDYTASEKA